jgi:antitoxin MazE
MLSHISKWGNSLGVRIPQAIAEQAGIYEGISIQLIIENNHILIKKKTDSLKSLLSKVNAENIHHEIESGTAVGKELW